MEIKKLLEPGRIGSLELKNRLIYSAMGLNSGDGRGFITERTIVSLEERARHGIGLVYAPGAYCHVPGGEHGTTISLSSDEYIPSLRRLTTRIKALGAAAGIQIGARGTRLEGHGQTCAPSSMRFAYEEQIPRALEVEEISGFITAFADAAVRAREAGFDIIELHACTGKLLSMFLSPYSNHRTDQYGGSYENRIRFVRETVEAMRHAVGDDFPLVVRLTVDDRLEGGLEEKDGIRIATDLCRAGVDGVQVSAGTQERIWNISSCYYYPEGNLLPFAAHVRHELGNVFGEGTKAVIAMSKLGLPGLAEKALQEGMGDFVSLGRPLLADPEWLPKVLAGKEDSIRRCLGCLNCFTYARRPALRNMGTACTVNPALLRENTFRICPSDSPRNILVAGGGLAGMEAALTLAQRGHMVELHEAGPRLGGQWIAASAGERKGEYRQLLHWYERELTRAGVAVFLNSQVNGSMLADKITAGVRALVVATGAEPNELRCTRLGSRQPEVVQGVDVLLNRATCGKRVVVIGGRYIGMEVAVKLAGEGKSVSLVDAAHIAQGTNPRISGIYLDQLIKWGVALFSEAPVIRLTPKGVDIAYLGALHSLPADTVVTAIGTHSVKGLETEAVRLGLEYRLIGDARHIGDALEAIREGAETGRTL